MKPTVLFIALILTVIAADGATVDNSPRRFQPGDTSKIYGTPIASGKALGDTIYLLGNPRDPNQYSSGGIGPQANGTFEDQFGNPGWFGWTSEDLTYDPANYWQVSDFNTVSGAYSMWCGTYFDGDPGYGNSWSQRLVFSYQVADNSVASTVNMAATIQVDTEGGYDYVYVEYNADGIWTVWNAGGYDGNRTVAFDDSVVYQPGDYGGGGDEIQLRIRFESDIAWSDEDGLWDTNGACQVDDIEVHVDGILVESEDFEDGPAGIYDWVAVPAPGVGDFAALYTNLHDLDPCRSNYSPQVAFVDNGVVVQGTGGTSCITWCYGPDGYIVNNTGGLMGPNFNLDNVVVSPVLEWPAGMDGAYVEFDMYTHEMHQPNSPWPGVLASCGIRSVASGNPADLQDTPWTWINHWWGFPEYWYGRMDIGQVLVPGCTHVQMCLNAWDRGGAYSGTDGTPAPYFDNAKFVAYPFAGPTIAGSGVNLFNDGFPEAGDLDLADLSRNNVRLDAVRNVAPAGDLANIPGDSIWFDIESIRTGAVLDDLPKLHFRLKANPLFDSVRVLPPEFVQSGNIISGWVYGDSTYNHWGALIENRYNFDLPDEGFFFPGDVMNYYIEAHDNQAGDIGITLLPGDTTGFHQVEYDLEYSAQFTVRALPTLFSATAGDQPRIIFWQDSDYRPFGSWQAGDERHKWHHALGQLGFRMGVDYDMYFTRVPHLPVGQGLGGRATSALLDGYDTLLYTSGYMFAYTLSNGDFAEDPSNDLQVISNWFARGDKNAFMTGDDLVENLLDSGSQGMAFVNSYFNVSYVTGDIRSLIANQTAPTVAAIDGNGVIARVPEWVSYAGCPTNRYISAIEANAGTTRLAEFTDPSGNPGAYPFAAGTYAVNAAENARVVLMPYDFASIRNTADWTPPSGYAGIPARAVILEDILDLFGEMSTSGPVGVAPDAVLSATSFPNPFNPTTTIKLSLPRTGNVSLKVYGIRGELIRTLVDGQLEAGTHQIIWDGTADQGNQVASGVYFYETKAGGETRISKMALVK